MRKIVICPKCQFVGSIEETDHITPRCPNCDTAMQKTDLTREDWEKLTAAQQQAFTARYVPASAQPAPAPAERKTETQPAPVAAPSDADTVRQMAADLRKMKKWLIAWGIVAIAGTFLLWLITIIALY